jgi:hypothetical protein
MKKIFMASVTLTTFAAAIALFQITSCKKSNAQTSCPPATYPITGLWEGTYQTDQVTHDPTYNSFAIYPDGTILRRSRVVSSTEYALFKGTWTLTGNLFQYRDTTVTYSGGYIINTGSLTFDNTGTLSGGTWQGITTHSSGTFQNMARIN